MSFRMERKAQVRPSSVGVGPLPAFTRQPLKTKRPTAPRTRSARPPRPTPGGVVSVEVLEKAHRAAWAVRSGRLTLASTEFGIITHELGSARGAPAKLAAALLRELIYEAIAADPEG